MTSLHMIASCTDRKRGRIAPERRLRSVRTRDAGLRLACWVDRVANPSSGALPVLDLYLGDHWAVARSLLEVARSQELDAELWVASAGHGLVPARAKLDPYSATFANGEADSVHRRTDPGVPASARRSWWTGLCSAQSLRHNAHPSSIAALARSEPHAAFLVIASPDYLSAMAGDVAAALDLVADRRRFVVVSSQNHGLPDALAECVLVTDVRLRSIVGGAAVGLNARTARWALVEASRSGFDVPTLRARLQALLRKAPALSVPQRVPVSDARVRSFIAAELSRDPDVSHTPTLRRFRSSGFACEQSRFRSLFNEVLGG